MTLWTDIAKIEEDIELRLATRTLEPSLHVVGALRAEAALAQHPLNFTDYLEATASPASACYRGAYAGFTDSLGNENWGDCGEAMATHGTEASEAAQAGAASVSPFVTDDALYLYSRVAGFVQSAGPPGSNPTDQGTDNAKLQSYMANPGLICKADNSTHPWIATAEVTLNHEVAQKVAIIDCVNLYRAVGLSINEQRKKAWRLQGDGKTGASKPGSWGYHDIPFQGFRANGDWLANSWGMLVPVGPKWDPIYAVQGFVAFDKSILAKTGISPSGLNYDKLVPDIRKVAGIS